MLRFCFNAFRKSDKLIFWHIPSDLQNEVFVIPYDSSVYPVLGKIYRGSFVDLYFFGKPALAVIINIKAFFHALTEKENAFGAVLIIEG